MRFRLVMSGVAAALVAASAAALPTSSKAPVGEIVDEHDEGCHPIGLVV